ncbi:MAG: hypothetical protein ACTHKB_11520 [Burkholderiaceae bacterium]
MKPLTDEEILAAITHTGIGMILAEDVSFGTFRKVALATCRAVLKAAEEKADFVAVAEYRNERITVTKPVLFTDGDKLFIKKERE